MPLLISTLATGLVAAATMAFNPMSFISSNWLLIGAVTTIAGLALVKYMSGDIAAYVGGGVAVAGVVMLATPMVNKVFASIKR